ncbi:flagellar hook-associated protein FlgK [uncultured Desulfuromonas sp.]|uniref:flagellar hook-associated protein FlgK n=1 Tax=uncultured Desulfuromonas sp. TaxID=181013 RepID=UPI002629ED14|nr:flagellar hook-associated protein FlgK [uncultured Desulfuromonas sp.]
MSGLFNALQIGKSSLGASQKGIEVTGGNLANVNTPGYSRQTAQVSSYPTLNMGGFLVGQGVRVDDVTRAHNSFLTRQIDSQSAALGQESAKAVPLADLERIANISETGLGGRIDGFFDAWKELSNDPASSAARDGVLQGGEMLATAFNQAADELEGVRRGIDDTLEGKIDAINGQLQEVADLNLRISSLQAAGQSAPADRDRRDQLLESLSSSLGIQHFDAGSGMVAVHLPGGLPPLVQEGEALALEANRSGDALQLQLKAGDRVHDLGVDNLGGEAGGLLEVRDQVLPGVQNDLDKLAYSLATGVNAVHAAGTDPSGAAGGAFFAVPAAPAPPADPWEGAAGSLATALSDTGQVAAGTSSASGDNTNALAMMALEDAPSVDGSTSFGRFYADMASRVGTEVSQNQLSLQGSGDALLQLQNFRDAQVGVSVEEEMVSLIQFQKGFEASAKFLATVDEMMDSLLNI